MKGKSLVALATLLLTVTTACWAAEDGAALYKAKCSACHGANGEGKPALKAPAIKGTTLDAKQIADHITKGEPTSKPPHNKGMAGINDDQATAIAQYVKSLK
jgi:mono/diheme cytochrome c family protein